ncbi:MAG: DNA helicase RecQ [Methanoregula sp.]
MHTCDDLLKKYWGYSSFLPHQDEIISSILDGQDTLAIMATGSGKSLCYQLPALVLGGLTIVISPLISLMKDQVDDLVARGIPAAACNSSLDLRERSRIERELLDGTLRLLFISPEKCMQENFLHSLKQCPVRLVAIDEAHCISEWGHNFRPEYRQLAAIKKHFPGVPVIALTATAIPEVRKDICRQLGLSDAHEYIGSFDRRNLKYRVIPKKNPLLLLKNFLSGRRHDSGIIYCMSKQETEDLAKELKKQGYTAAAYHAGLPKQVRETVQDAFIHDNIHIVCATVAFGMGINKPDVRFVVHYDLPKTLESYYQETGRAGRDGQESECVLFFSRGDCARVRSMLEHDDASGQHLSIALGKLRDMVAFCETTGCRRKFLLTYFGEEYPGEQCGSCDTCDHPPDRVDGTVVARLIVGCVHRLPARFGIEIISDVLRGSKNVRIQKYRLDTHPSYGAGKKYSKAQYRAWINDLVLQGFLERTGDAYPVIGTGRKCEDLLDGKVRVMLAVPAACGGTASPSRHTPTGNDGELFRHLKSLRKSIADRNCVPPYVIFPDRSLLEMASSRPRDRAQFGCLPGVGEFKLKTYGPAFIAAIRTWSDEQVAYGGDVSI